ncbi:hypothetical protein M9H77_23221 [Catharanthus roseus]|uniref:Uncharacterized protein n=1 Tax=Catharanthus roseus TaxID=4058 RepID=A0ACC0ASE2_CATRO|nr:hypothetical protein M9H77_23221 [Catharanthus roseus]
MEQEEDLKTSFLQECSSEYEGILMINLEALGTFNKKTKLRTKNTKRRAFTLKNFLISFFKMEDYSPSQYIAKNKRQFFRLDQKGIQPSTKEKKRSSGENNEEDEGVVKKATSAPTLDMDDEVNFLIVLGFPFLRTSRVLIDMQKEKLVLRENVPRKGKGRPKGIEKGRRLYSIVKVLWIADNLLETFLSGE